MKVVYYPEKADQSLQTPLRKFIEYELQKKSFVQWSRMIHWLRGLKNDMTNAETLSKEIRSNSERLKGLKKGLYEYRGSQSQKGTIRLYFCYDKETVYILDAEFKTDGKNIIDRARKRKSKLGLK